MSNEEFLDAFSKCTVSKTSTDGRCSIKCKLGLWGVDSPSRDTALNEALWYFQQYKSDGEYSGIIGGPTAMEVFADKL